MYVCIYLYIYTVTASNVLTPKSPNPKQVLFMESPSSLTFELHDFAALAAVAHTHSAAVLFGYNPV